MSNGISIANELLQPESETDTCRSRQFSETFVSSCSPVQPKNTEDLRTWLRQAFPASRSALPGAEPEPTIAATCGRQLSNASAWYDRGTHCWKTYQALLLADILEQSWATWPKAGMTQAGVFYRQPSWERRISEIGCGLLPSPKAIDRYGIETSPQNHAKYGSGMTLTQAARRSMWPTPTVFDSTGAQRSPEAAARAQAGRAIPGRNGGAPKNLREEVLKVPSPAARDWRSGSGRQENGHSPQLPETVGGMLNPDWVEWLMGWPIGWTDLKPLGMDRFRLWFEQFGNY